MYRLWERVVRLNEFATDVLEILQQTERLPYLEGSFDYFAAPAAGAQALCEELAEYEQSCGREIQDFLSRYLPYRLYTVLLERPEEAKESRARQVFGEAVVWYVIHLSRFYSLKDRPEAVMSEELAWMYRFCVHSILREQAFRNMLEQSFPQPEGLMELIW